MRHSLPIAPQFYVTAPQACPYLDDRQERKLFAALQGDEAQSLNNCLSKQGFRRSQNVLYRPTCLDCAACLSARVEVKQFFPNKSQKRIQVLCEEAGEKIWVTKDRDDFIKNLTGISMTELDEKYGASTISENYRRWATRFNNSDKIIQQKLDNQILYTILDNQTYDK